MKDNDLTAKRKAAINRSMEAAWERSGEPPLRDILKREHDEAQKRPRNEALEKWGPMIEEAIERDLERERRQRQPNHSCKLPTPSKQPTEVGPDMDIG